MKAARNLPDRKFPPLPDSVPPLAALPYITPQTIVYALSTVISCVCYTANDNMTRGRQEILYEKLMADYDQFNPEDFAELLRDNLTEWMTKVNAAEPPGPAPPVMSQQRVAAADRARPSTMAAVGALAAAAAAAAADSDHDADGDGDGHGDGEKVEDSEEREDASDKEGAEDADTDGGGESASGIRI